MELELKQRLDVLGNENRILQKSMDQILELLKGSTLMNSKGIIEDFRTFETKMGEVVKQVEHWERWRQMQIAKKGTFTFRTADLFTKGLSIFGAASLIVTIIFTGIQIYDWYDSKISPKGKQQQETPKQSQPRSSLTEKTYLWMAEQLPESHFS